MAVGQATEPAQTHVELSLLIAGHTTHRAGISCRGTGFRRIDFPALVALIRHPQGVILFDTGYAPRVIRAMEHGINRVYGRLLPVHVEESQTAVAQLARRGISAHEVSHVVVSHLHADHVGGLRDFPSATIVVASTAVREALTTRGITRLRRGLLPELLPDDIRSRILDVSTIPGVPDAASRPRFPCHDLLGDGTIAVVELPGHAAGHLGMLVRAQRDVFLVSDAVWDVRAYTEDRLPHPIARIATASWRKYRETIRGIGQFAATHPDVLVIPSHDSIAIEEAQKHLRKAEGCHHE